ncbi:MAG: PadR family transcriptional regulator [Actinoplanes sp.]
MSIRYGLLSLLRHGPMYGYQLRSAFEQVTSGSWPLNIGQVYTTLGRLSRDGLIEPRAEGENGQQPFALTEAGAREAEEWFMRPLSAAERPRDELAIKIALAMSTPGIDATAVIQQQRTATMRSLQETTRLTRHDDADLAWRLLLDRLLLELDAQLRWLDKCDEMLAEYPPPGPPDAVLTAEQPALEQPALEQQLERGLQ